MCAAADTKYSPMTAINKDLNSTLKVLLVDDNHDSTFVKGMLLNLLGFQIQTCNNGPDCVMLAESTTPHVILLDIDMPIMNGFQVCKHIRNQHEEKNLQSLLLAAGITVDSLFMVI